MNLVEQGRVGALDWAVAGRAFPGHSVSGDAYVVLPHGDQVTMAVIDGLGHGPPAEVAATTAVETIRSLHGEPIDVLLQRCHEKLRGTRGAAITAVSLRLGEGTLTWAGVGNVDACVVRTDVMGTTIMDRALPLSGVVGLEIPVLQPRTVQLQRGDLVIMVTDGVRTSWPAAIRRGRRLAEMAGELLDGHARPADDALVLAARYESPR